MKAITPTLFWIFLAFLFNIFIYIYMGQEAALTFLAGYLIEKALSVDNLFVFLILFKRFDTPPQYQHRVLYWGIIGAVIMRGVMIFCGLALIQTFEWILYVFGIFLIYTAVRIVLDHDKEETALQNSFLKWVQQRIPMTENYQGYHFFVRRAGKWLATPLFITLLAIELTDLVFALDSIPAIISITQDPFIIYTSNIFAILGLRSLFFVLAQIMTLFRYLHYGLAFILLFVGLKMLFSSWIHVPVILSLGIIASSLMISIVYSILKR